MLKLIISALVASLALPLMTLGSCGFCFSSQSFYSDNELIDRFIGGALELPDDRRLAGVTTVSDFHKKYPHFSHVAKNEDGLTVLLQYFGGARKDVSIRYTFEQGGKERDRVFIYTVDCCGVAVSEISG